MSAQLRPNRLTINDRFPMLGFTIRTDATPQHAEVALATDPALFDEPAQRTTTNFFTTREFGKLSVPKGEVVYIVPPEVLSRFIGSQRLYFALATAPADNGDTYQVQVKPGVDSPYISIADLTSRGLRRVRVTPGTSPSPIPGGYGSAGQNGLHWAGDEPQVASQAPGNQAGDSRPMEPAPQNSGQVSSTTPGGNAASPPAPSAPTDYDDGFGPMPAMPPSTPPQNEGDAATAQVLEFSLANMQLGERTAAPAPQVRELSSTEAILVETALRAVPVVSAAVATARLAANTGNVSIGIGPSVSGGFVAGAQLGVGLIIAPNNHLGVYGSVEGVAGLITSISATAQVTVLGGGISSFSGITYTAGISVGEGLIGGGSIIFDAQGSFLGISAQIGIGAGFLPLDLYLSAQRSVATQLGYATAYGPASTQTQGLARYPQAMEIQENFTLNWDEVQSIAQPTDVSCWAAAAAMVVGWRDRMSLSPQTIAEIAGRTTATGLDPRQVGQFANEMGLHFEQPMSYTEEGFRQLVENNGPLWVAASVPGLHAIVVTGIYKQGTQLYVRITDPWDRAAGTPGSPGAYANTHATGSRYILRWEDFVREYEAAAIDYSHVNLQILHSGGTGGRLPNYGEVSPPPGYAQSYATRGFNLTENQTDQIPGQQVEFPPPGVTLHRSRTEVNGVQYDLFLMDGRVTPQTPPQVAQDLIPGQQILINEWPYIDSPGGRNRGGLVIDWSYGAGAVANVRTTPSGGQAFDDWKVVVHADVAPGPSTPTETKLKVSIRTTFSRAGEADQVGVSEVILSGSGQHQVSHRSEPMQAPIAA